MISVHRRRKRSTDHIAGRLIRFLLAKTCKVSQAEVRSFSWQLMEIIDGISVIVKHGLSCHFPSYGAQMTCRLSLADSWSLRRYIGLYTHYCNVTEEDDAEDHKEKSILRMVIV
jgi:hypothetical protein